MLIDQVAIKYAQALYELVVEKDMLSEAEAQLTDVEKTINEHNDLAKLLYHPMVEAQAKKEVVKLVFGDGLAELVYNFLLLLIDKRREAILPAILKEFRNLVNQARDIVEIEVVTAMPLTEDEHNALIGKLSSVTGKNAVLRPKLDPSILGGVIIKIGDKLIDGSVARQLKTLENTLKKAPVA